MELLHLRSQLSLELHVLKLEGLDGAAVVGAVEVGSDNEERIIAGIADASPFGIWVKHREGLPYDGGFIDVNHGHVSFLLMFLFQFAAESLSPSAATSLTKVS